MTSLFGIFMILMVSEVWSYEICESTTRGRADGKEINIYAYSTKEDCEEKNDCQDKLEMEEGCNDIVFSETFQKYECHSSSKVKRYQNSCGSLCDSCTVEEIFGDCEPCYSQFCRVDGCSFDYGTLIGIIVGVCAFICFFVLPVCFPMLIIVGSICIVPFALVVVVVVIVLLGGGATVAATTIHGGTIDTNTNTGVVVKVVGQGSSSGSSSSSSGEEKSEEQENIADFQQSSDFQPQPQNSFPNQAVVGGFDITTPPSAPNMGMGIDGFGVNNNDNNGMMMNMQPQYMENNNNFMKPVSSTAQAPPPVVQLPPQGAYSYATENGLEIVQNSSDGMFYYIKRDLQTNTTQVIGLVPM